jgi:hypothetical protein
MGRREGGQEQFFYAFDLDELVPPDHLVRQIDAVLDCVEPPRPNFFGPPVRQIWDCQRCDQHRRIVACSVPN